MSGAEILDYLTRGLEQQIEINKHYDDILKEILAIIPPIMESVYKVSVPLSVETKIGKNLGELK